MVQNLRKRVFVHVELGEGEWYACGEGQMWVILWLEYVVIVIGCCVDGMCCTERSYSMVLQYRENRPS